MPTIWLIHDDCIIQLLSTGDQFCATRSFKRTAESGFLYMHSTMSIDRPKNNVCKRVCTRLNAFAYVRGPQHEASSVILVKGLMAIDLRRCFWANSRLWLQIHFDHSCPILKFCKESELKLQDFCRSCQCAIGSTWSGRHRLRVLVWSLSYLVVLGNPTS